MMLRFVDVALCAFFLPFLRNKSRIIDVLSLFLQRKTHL